MPLNLSSVETPLLLALDVGTSSIRAIGFDRLARPVEGLLAQVPTRLHMTAEGGAEFDPAELLAGVVFVIDQVLAQAGSLAGQIGGVAMATLVTTMLGLDSTGRPLTPLFSYADTRSTPDADELRRGIGDEAAAYARTGCRIHSAYWPARFRWLARTRPDLLKTAARWVAIGDYLLLELFGRSVTSYSVASWSGLLNRHHLAWDQEWLAYLDLDEQRLASLVDVDQPLAGLRSPWAERWPALKEVPWFPAMGDGAAANLGSGCDTPQRVALTMGTTGAMRVVLPHAVPEVPAGLWIYRVDRRRSLLGGATSEGGNVFAWLSQTLQLPDNLEAELPGLGPVPDGLIVLPFVAGERAPGWSGDARASLIGFNLNTRPVEILRAGLEGVAYRFALIHQRIVAHLPSDHQIIVSGSALLNSPAWLQIMADVLGYPLVASAEKEATSRGVAGQALAALGLGQLPPAATGQVYTPHPENHALYREAVARQVDYYNKLVRGG